MGPRSPASRDSGGGRERWAGCREQGAGRREQGEGKKSLQPAPHTPSCLKSHTYSRSVARPDRCVACRKVWQAANIFKLRSDSREV